jgi:hypothetical protein
MGSAVCLGSSRTYRTACDERAGRTAAIGSNNHSADLQAIVSNTKHPVHSMDDTHDRAKPSGAMTAFEMGRAMMPASAWRTRASGDETASAGRREETEGIVLATELARAPAAVEERSSALECFSGWLSRRAKVIYDPRSGAGRTHRQRLSGAADSDILIYVGCALPFHSPRR